MQARVISGKNQKRVCDPLIPPNPKIDETSERTASEVAVKRKGWQKKAVTAT